MLDSTPLHSRARAGEEPRVVVAAAAIDALAAGIAAALAAAGLAPARPVTSLTHLARRTGALDADVVVVAGDLQAPDTLMAVRSVVRRRHECAVVLVASPPHPLDARRALNAGATGYLQAIEVEDALEATVRAVHAGLLCTSRAGRRALAKPSFSAREKQVMAMVASGATNAEIARRLYVSESTVKSHLASIFRKLGVRSRHDAVSLILDPDEGLRATALPAQLGPAQLG